MLCNFFVDRARASKHSNRWDQQARGWVGWGSAGVPSPARWGAPADTAAHQEVGD